MNSKGPIPQRAMNVYSDNVRVGRSKDRDDFLTVAFNDPDDDKPWIVYLNRYMVPGRLDVYNFDWVPGGCGVGSRLRFFTDINFSLERALKIVQRDLDKPQVADMLVTACGGRRLPYARTLLHLVGSLGKKTRSYRAVLKAVNVEQAAVNVRIAERRRLREGE